MTPQHIERNRLRAISLPYTRQVGRAAPQSLSPPPHTQLRTGVAVSRLRRHSSELEREEVLTVCVELHRFVIQLQSQPGIRWDGEASLAVEKPPGRHGVGAGG